LPDGTRAEFGYPEGTVGWAYKKAMATRARSYVVLGKKLQSSHKDSYVRCWKYLRRFAHRKPGTITEQEILDLQTGLLKSWKYEAHKTIGLWFWLCDRMAEYALMPPRRPGSHHLIRNPMPPGRDKFFFVDEVDWLIETATEYGYHGLALAIAIMWDTMLSPIDVRTATPAMLQRHPRTGSWFFNTRRKKTSKKAVGTLTPRTLDMIAAYVQRLGGNPPRDEPLIRTPTGAPYTESWLGRNFAIVRDMVFGKQTADGRTVFEKNSKGKPLDNRALIDMRRSGAIEADVGGADRRDLDGKMANTISQSKFLAETYIGHQTESQLIQARRVDEARIRGREILREAVKTTEDGLTLLRKATGATPRPEPQPEPDQGGLPRLACKVGQHLTGPSKA